MLFQIAALAAVVLIVVALSPMHAIALLCVCVLLALHPVLAALAIGLAAGAFVLVDQLSRKSRRGPLRRPNRRRY
jgi:hypothetical protein